MLVLASTVSQVYMPVFVRHAIDSLTRGTATTESLLLNGLYIVGASLVSGVCFYLVRMNIIVASREIEYDLRNDFLSHILRLSTRFYQNTPQGEVMAYATNDINAVRNFVGPAVMYSADTIATFIFVMAFMIGISPVLTFWTILPLPLMSIGVYLVGKRVHPLFDAVQSHYSDLTSRTTESISGMRVVRAYVREKFETSVFDKLNQGYLDKNMKLVKVQGLMMPIIFFFVGLSIIPLLLIGGPMVIRKELSLGGLTQMVLYLGMLTWPFIALGWVTNMIQRSAASMKRLAKVLDMEAEIKNDANTDRSITEITGDIEFKDVSLKYRPELEPALSHIDLKIEAGSTIAIIGRTGSGKSTLVSLISRLYDVTGGTLTVDGHDIRTIPIETLRAAIGYVSQEAFLFSDTVANNIAFSSYGTSTALTSDQVHDAARVADIYDNIAEFPEGFETMIGERGITLSGGQKQRTAMARAIARDPKILILDDSMSAVDTATEERILSNLKRIMKGRTSILISHRVSTVKEADRIFVMDHGQIIEQGTHHELLNAQGVYHSLYRRQLLEEALENA